MDESSQKNAPRCRAMGAAAYALGWLADTSCQVAAPNLVPFEKKVGWDEEA